MASRLRSSLLLALSTGAFGAAAAPAGAVTSVSSNWAGYAVTGSHGTTAHFRRVAATWVVKRTDCAASGGGSEVTWVGIGGYELNAQALEQTGTAVDCSATGRASYYAWYELVPAPVRRFGLKVHVGDRIAALVTVNGTKVTFQLRNVTRKRKAVHVAHTASPDTASAEWIAEAPSGCNSFGDCQILPLADFGSVTFTGASATTSRGHTGAINDKRWQRDQIRLAQGGSSLPGFVSDSSAGATPSGLSERGHTFTVRYHGSSASAASVRARRALPATRLPR